MPCDGRTGGPHHAFGNHFSTLEPKPIILTLGIVAEVYFQSIQLLGVVGWVSCICMNTGALKFTMHFRLPGLVQTVARAEVFACLTIAQCAMPKAEIVFITDNLLLNDTFAKGRDRACKCTTGDLYASLFDAIIHKELKFELKWMPSHTGDSDSECDNGDIGKGKGKGKRKKKVKEMPPWVT